MDPLTGWTVGVTADRRAAEQASMLERRGATVLRGALLEAAVLDPEEGWADATRALIDHPPSTVVLNTSFGVRSWFASAHSAGMGEDLCEALAGARVVARGPKAAGAAVAEGLVVAWRAQGETMDEVVSHLSSTSLRGERVAFLEHGAPSPATVERLEDAGASVTTVPVYRWRALSKDGPAGRLAAAIAAGDVDAVTFTSPPAVDQLAVQHPEALAALRSGDVVTACVGPVTAQAAAHHGIVDVLCPRPSRIGAMVRTLAETFAARSQELSLGGVHVVLQGAALSVAGTVVRLGPRERELLTELLAARSAVVSKQALAQRCIGGGEVDEHAVEVAVNRLRRKLGPAARALQTSNRRGYRLEADDLTARPLRVAVG